MQVHTIVLSGAVYSATFSVGITVHYLIGEFLWFNSHACLIANTIQTLPNAPFVSPEIKYLQMCLATTASQTGDCCGNKIKITLAKFWAADNATLWHSLEFSLSLIALQVKKGKKCSGQSPSDPESFSGILLPSGLHGGNGVDSLTLVLYCFYV